MKHFFPYLLLVALVLVLYGNTINHGFVLDDDVVISKNTFVHKGFGGIKAILSNDSFAGHERVGEGQTVLAGGRYRPLSLVLFAVVYEFFEWKATPFHVLAILLYAGVVVMLYKTLHYLLRDLPKGRLIALSASVLFAVHPVHTEVVANIKSCDETLALLFGLCSMYAMLRAYDDKSKNWVAISGISMLLACLSKESAVTLAVAIPLALWFFRHATIKDVVKHSIPIILGAAIYIVIRMLVLQHATPMDMMADPLNDPFLKWNEDKWVPFTTTERLATISFVWWEYLRLLLFPYPLTHDYYPFVIDAHTFKSALDWLGIISLLGLSVWGVWCLIRRREIGFSILFYIITLSVALNLFFPIGTFMAERFLFTPSVGFCLGIVMLMVVWQRQLSKKHNWMLAPGIIIVGLFAVLTVMRNRDWKDNITLHKSALVTSAKSVKLQNDYGTIKLNQALGTADSLQRKLLIDTAFTHLQNAVTTHHTYFDALLAYGAASYYKGEYEFSVWAYQKAKELSPDDPKAETGLFYALQGFANFQVGQQDYKKAVDALKMAYQMYPDTTLEKRIQEFQAKIK